MFTLKIRNCSCGAKPNELHRLGCDVERCPHCGMQLISCESLTDIDIEYADRLPWSGEWPGKKECREFNLWCCGPESEAPLKWLPGETPWMPCDSDHPRATEDLNRLYSVACWDAKQRRWILKPQ